jgi:hypothetical protein
MGPGSGLSAMWLKSTYATIASWTLNRELVGDIHKFY